MSATHRRFQCLLHASIVAAMLLATLFSAVMPVHTALASPAADPTSVVVVGDLQSELGCTGDPNAGDWHPDCANTGLAYDADDDVWQNNWNIPAGNWLYKAALNGTWGENYGANAVAGGDNIPLNLTAATDVKFFYDHKTHWIADNFNNVIAVAPGSFQSELGCAADWDAGCLRSWLQDSDGDGIYTFETAAIPAGSYAGKVALNEGWAENYGAGGVAGGNDIPFTVANNGDVVTFTYTPGTHVLEITVAAPGGPNYSVALVGTLQSELGCAGDWAPDCANTEMLHDAEDDVWQQSFSLPSGGFEYKVALNNSWDENYGANAVLNGAGIPLTLTAASDIKFYYDHKSHWVADNQTSVIAVAPGSFQSELGCAADWAPGCLRSWLQDPDGDGTYQFTTSDIPVGNYAGKVAINEGWAESYGDAGGNDIPFSVGVGDSVTFSYVAATHLVTITVTPPVVDLATIVQAPVRHPVANDIFYFVMPDRFANGNPANDQGGLAGDRSVTGLDPADKGYYHGGDLAGLLSKLDYLDQMGVTAIWMTPMFKNRPVQGSGANASAAYHGYWTVDYSQVDPHFGTNAELQQLIDDSHSRGINVFFDIVVNHTADIISYQENQYTYRSKADFPYRDDQGLPFEDRDYINSPAFPVLNAATSFAYTPVVAAADANAKVPAWLNNPIFYHNRGDSTFSGENSLYGDFFGLDDLFTEHPQVVSGMTDIFKGWITNFGIDGFRLDTVKHVNAEFWKSFAPAILAHAAAQGKPDFFLFGEIYSANEQLLSYYSTSLNGDSPDLPAVLDFGFQAAARSFAAGGSATDGLKSFFEKDDWYTDSDSNAYSLMNFLGNHDMGRIGYFIQSDAAGADDAERLARTELAHALMYFARGVPIVYYGDEQGFVGDGNDKDARQDMMPSQVASYNDDDLIGTTNSTADDNFDATHPVYTTLADFATLYQNNKALRTGAQIHRYSSGAAGIYAFSRMDRDEKVEYVVAFNNAESAQSATFDVYEASATYSAVWPAGAASLTSTAGKQLTVDVPALSFAIYKAAAPATVAAASVNNAPNISLVSPATDAVVELGYQNLDGNRVPDRMKIEAALDRSNTYAEVSFAVRETGAPTFTLIGVDDNPPYRVYYDASAWPAGTRLEFIAVVNDLSGLFKYTRSTNVEPMYATGGGGLASYDHAVIHYLRSDGDYGDHSSGDFNNYWGLHLWGDAIDPTEATDWAASKPFTGEDGYGHFAWIKLQNAAKDVNFILHRGNTKDGTEADRKFNPASDGPEIWLKQGDPNFYTSQAAAQGFVTIHYSRPDAVYTGWGLHLWGDGLGDGVGTSWASPRPADGTDAFGVFWTVPLKDVTKQVNFIIHNGDAKDPGPDQNLMPEQTAAVWIKSGSETIFPQACAANNVAVLHYHRNAANDYGDYASANYVDFWGMHTWQDANVPGLEWTKPLKPTRQDLFGQVFEVPLNPAPKQIGYILHRGDTKDPGPDQFLEFAKWGCEVWQLEGADPQNPYTLPILKGAVLAGDLSKYKAHWISQNTIAWDIKPNPSLEYRLYYTPTGGMQLVDNAIVGGAFIKLIYDPAGLSAEQKAMFPHLAQFKTFKLPSAALSLAPEILKGQIAIAAVQSGAAAASVSELAVNATGLQIPGVLDELYTYTGTLGVIYNGGAPTLRLWAPTAKSVKLHLFDSSAAATASQIIDMMPGEKGTWSAVGDGSWMGKFYLYEVEVYVHSTGQVEHNMVTDPYSIALSTNSVRSEIVDLNDPALKPAGWDALAKPALAAPEDIVLYELHVRDFSITDASVPETERGTFKAFTHADSAGMQHLKALADAGLTHVHLLPAFDFATINEDKAARVEPAIPANAAADSEEQQAAVNAVRDQDGFNWGYDPYHYNVPEGSYSTNPDGSARILEFREMVQALNTAGLRVVLDVVYNHTTASGQQAKSVLDKVTPGYYHRLNLDGAVETSTCCQNTATEHAMMEKLMVDSVALWASAYKVDGFRFDLMGHHMKSNMEKVRDTLAAIDPTSYVYGEGWNFGEVANNARGVNATQLNLAATGIGTFSDRLRDAVRGGGPFDNGNSMISNQGFVSGLYYDPNALNSGSDGEKNKLLLYADQIRVGLAGNLADYELVDRTGATVKGSQVDYNGAPAGYTQDPQENIVYVEAHDNQTQWDISAYKHAAGVSMADRVRGQMLGLDITLLAQGVPFVHAGQELLRSKSFDRNSYNSGDWFNKLDFTYNSNNWGVGAPMQEANGGDWALMKPLLANPSLKPAQSDILTSFNHVKELLKIRSSSPLFRLQTEAEIMARLSFLNTGPTQIPGVIVMVISDKLDQPTGASVVTSTVDLDPNLEEVVVVFNASDTAQTITATQLVGLPLLLHSVQDDSVDSVVQQSTFVATAGSLSVPARTTAVFVQPQTPTALDETDEPGAPTALDVTAEPDAPLKEHIYLPLLNR